MDVAIIGGGAAGFFAAINCKSFFPHANVTIYEKSSKVLSKVKISGGGRCNVTNACFNINQLVKNYPRGGSALKKPFNYFNPAHTIEWFQKHGVKLKTEEDNRIFPVSDSSQTIVDCLVSSALRAGVLIKYSLSFSYLEKKDQKFKIFFSNNSFVVSDKVIIATGGNPSGTSFDWLRKLGHRIENPVPSLFTFNMPLEPITSLSGLSVDPVTVKVEGTKLKETGPLLVTHWGMSGPVILQTSAWGARELSNIKYKFKIHINWLNDLNEQQVNEILNAELNSKRKLANANPVGLPARLWEFLLQKSGIDGDILWINSGKRNINKLINILTNDIYQVKGKTTFKEEFVTCGGVVLTEVDMETMESKICKGLYFAGEVLNIDGVTGGFNFQAAWTTGYLAGKCCCLI